MKRKPFECAWLLAILLTACSRETAEDAGDNRAKTPPGNSPKPAEIVSRSMPAELQSKPSPPFEDRYRSMKFLEQRGLKGLGQDSMLERRAGLSKSQKRASEEDVRKNREAEAKLKERQWAEARKNIQSKDPDVRLEALSGLDLEDPQDLALLEQALLSDASAEVREEAAMQLSVGDPKVAVPALLDALTDPESEVAVAAIDSLSSIDTDDQAQIVEVVKNLAETHPDEDVRDAAATALEALQ